MNESTQRHPASDKAATTLPDDVELEKCYEKIFDGIQAGATFKDMYGIAPETLEAIYAHAYGYYQQGRLDDAESLFRLLVTYDFYNVDYALGLGAVFQLRKRYGKALDVYAVAYTISGGDSRPMLYAGQCNLLLHRRGKARRCFEMVIEESADELLVRQARAYLNAIKRTPASPGENKDMDVKHDKPNTQ